jgi:hypothetical protein
VEKKWPASFAREEFASPRGHSGALPRRLGLGPVLLVDAEARIVGHKFEQDPRDARKYTARK